MILWSNQTKQIKWHESCKCECKLNSSACNNKQRWNKDKCRCECKELVNKQERDKGFIWNLCNCNCKCDKSCNYLIITSINENHKTSKYKTPSKLFFNDITNIEDFDRSLLNVYRVSPESNAVLFMTLNTSKI